MDQTRLLPLNTTVEARVPWRGTALALAGVVVCWTAAVAAGTMLHPVGLVHDIGLFVHLVSLVVGFGAVLVLEVYGASVVLGRRGPVEVARFAAALDPMIWAGLAGLVVSGAALSPNVGSPATWLKLSAVLVVALNGINAHHLCARLTALPATRTLRELPTRLKIRLLGTGAISQAAWWTAVLVGFWANLH
ncbi:hypothetical protein [Actinoplanes sp. NPDC026623]|uniref:hypothetical protein n=1 Tax=Actinoplanes sp. NPDC026623 TaxID=3155610 RepID=UPI00341063FA